MATQLDNVISAEAFAKMIRKLDEVVREEARRIHAENSRHGSESYKQHTLNGAYDSGEELVALRQALRRGIEIGRAM